MTKGNQWIRLNKTLEMCIRDRRKVVPKPDEVDMQQLSFFDTVKDDDIIKELSELEINSMTPVDAMNTLYRLQNKLKNRWKDS